MNGSFYRLDTDPFLGLWVAEANVPRRHPLSSQGAINIHLCDAVSFFQF